MRECERDVFSYFPGSIFERCEQECIALRRSSKDRGSLPVHDSDRLATALEWLVPFDDHEATRGLWCDGIEFYGGRAGDRDLWLQGIGWCVGHEEQWQVPVKVEFLFSELETSRLEVIRYRWGDRTTGSIRDHISRRYDENPDEWCVTLQVDRPKDPPVPDPESRIEELQAWTNAHPSRPLVGPEWEYLTHEQARSLIVTWAGLGRETSLEETWLDKGPALRLCEAGG